MVSDDQGWNDIGYHNEELRTPNLDALCAERRSVESALRSAAVHSDASRAADRSLSESIRELIVRRPRTTKPLPLGTPTLASVLVEMRATRPGMSGKWHLGSRAEWGPNHYGFQASHGSLAGAVGMYDHRYRLSSPFANTWHRRPSNLSRKRATSPI